MNNKKQYTFDEILGKVDISLEGIEHLRAENLEKMATIQQVNAKALEKERQRLSIKYGVNDPRVKRLDAQLQFNQGFTQDLKVEIDKAKIQVPPFDKNTWMVHGRVLKQENNVGIEGLTVSLANEDGQWMRQLGYACTDERGYFAIIYPPKEGKPSSIPASQSVFLMVSDRNRRILYRSSEALSVQIGQMIYREIFLSEDTGCVTPPEPETPDVPVEVRSINSSTELTINQLGSFSATVNPDATQPVDYLWNFGDNSSASGLTANHRYTRAGTYTVTFTASNQVSTDSESMTVNVKALSITSIPAKILKIVAAPMNPDICTPVRFSAEVRGNLPITYAWNFGDNSTATTANPSHTYSRAGTYSVTLTVSNAAGSDTRSLTLIISRVDPDIWLARGRVVDEKGQGIEGLVVSLYDHDLCFDDQLGTTQTDGNGDFAIAYRTEDFQDLFEAHPDLYMKVMDGQGNLLYSSENTVRCEAGRIEVFNITIRRSTGNAPSQC